MKRPRLVHGDSQRLSQGRVLTGTPNFLVQCPTCGQRLLHLVTARQTQVYECKIDGLMLRAPDGTLRPASTEATIQLLLKPEE